MASLESYVPQIFARLAKFAKLAKIAELAKLVHIFLAFTKQAQNLAKLEKRF
jgi:hypothetical protein